MGRLEALALDQGLKELAVAYAVAKPCANAVDRLLAEFRQTDKRFLRGQRLSDDDLDWLAAAGPGFPLPPDKP